MDDLCPRLFRDRDGAMGTLVAGYDDLSTDVVFTHDVQSQLDTQPDGLLFAVVANDDRHSELVRGVHGCI
jgi:hypothetical protein